MDRIELNISSYFSLQFVSVCVSIRLNESGIRQSAQILFVSAPTIRGIVAFLRQKNITRKNIIFYINL